MKLTTAMKPATLARLGPLHGVDRQAVGELARARRGGSLGAQPGQVGQAGFQGDGLAHSPRHAGEPGGHLADVGVRRLTLGVEPLSDLHPHLAQALQGQAMGFDEIFDVRCLRQEQK